MPCPTVDGLQRQVLDVLSLVENQIVGVAEVGQVAISTEAARQIAMDLGVRPTRNFWLLFSAAARTRVSVLIQQVNERQESDRHRTVGGK